MARTGAERQAAYRARQAVADSGQRRISTWISTDAATALEILAHRYGVTMRGVIETLLLRECEISGNRKADQKFSSKKSSRKKLSLPGNDVAGIDSSVGEVSVGPLPRNEVSSVAAAAIDEAREAALLHNDLFPVTCVVAVPENALPGNEDSTESVATEPLPQTRATSSPAQEEQYSLEF